MKIHAGICTHLKSQKRSKFLLTRILSSEFSDNFDQTRILFTGPPQLDNKLLKCTTFALNIWTGQRKL